MTFPDAILAYLKYNLTGRKTLWRLTEWTPSLSIIGNANLLKISLLRAYQLKGKYHLKCRTMPKQARSSQSWVRVEAMRECRRYGYTLAQIGKRFKCSKQAVEQLLRPQKPR